MQPFCLWTLFVFATVRVKYDIAGASRAKRKNALLIGHEKNCIWFCTCKSFFSVSIVVYLCAILPKLQSNHAVEWRCMPVIKGISFILNYPGINSSLEWDSFAALSAQWVHRQLEDDSSECISGNGQTMTSTNILIVILIGLIKSIEIRKCLSAWKTCQHEQLCQK